MKVGLMLDTDQRFGVEQIEVSLALRWTARTRLADAPALFDVYLSLDGTFKLAALSAQTGAGSTQVSFAGAQIARYVKIVLTQDKSTNWWGIRELNVDN